jgi:hypothetical protein
MTLEGIKLGEVEIGWWAHGSSNAREESPSEDRLGEQQAFIIPNAQLRLEAIAQGDRSKNPYLQPDHYFTVSHRY